MDVSNSHITYTPVKHQRGRQRPKPINIAGNQERSSSPDPASINTTRLKYLDEDDDDDVNNSHIQREVKDNASTETAYGNDQIYFKRQHQAPAFEIEDSVDDSYRRRVQAQDYGIGNELGEGVELDVGLSEQDSLEEVYLCNCCGVTKELDPAMKYMPLFKSLFILFNLLALVFGLADLGMGLWFRIDPKVYELHHHIETQNFTIAGWILLFGGLLASLLALLIGFAASARHSICLLIFYSIIMAVLSITFIGTLVLMTVYGLGDSLERFMTKEMYEQIRRRTMGSEFDLLTSSDAAQFIDFVQVKMRCCGAQDFRDYQKLGMVIPATCYTIAGNYINAPGCGSALKEMFETRVSLATGFAAGSVVAQILATLLAGLMVCSIYNYRAQPRPASAISMARSRSLAGSPERAAVQFTSLSPTTKSTSNNYRNSSNNYTNNGCHDQPPPMSSRPISRSSSIEV